MDQQCNATAKHWTFKMSTSGHKACPQPKSPWMNHLINDRLSVNQTLLQLINISDRMLTVALPRFCYQQD